MSAKNLEVMELLRPLDDIPTPEPFDITSHTISLQYYIGKPVKKLSTTLVSTGRNYSPRAVIDGIIAINKSLGECRVHKDILGDALKYIATVTDSTIVKIHILKNSVIQCVASSDASIPDAGTTSLKIIDRRCIELFRQELILSTSSLDQDPRKLLTLLIQEKGLTELVSIPIIDSDLTARITLAGTKIYTNDTISSMLIPYSKALTHIIDSARDISEAEKKLKSMEQECSSKDMFLATMSHEIRTPLNGIMGIISMLNDSGPLNSRQKKHVQTLMECAVELTSLLNNILDYSKISSNRLSLSLKGESIGEIVEASLKIAGGNAYMKRIEMKSIVDEKLESKTILCDKQRLLQILGNLLGNAIKFTSQEGTITCRVQVVDDKIVFEVEDTGCGIEEENLNSIFDIFYQVYTTTSTPTDGSGLGLPISKELVKLMGGEIVAKSAIGKGTIVSFDIPLNIEEQSKEDILKENESLLKGKKILIVDSKADMRLYLSSAVLKWGCMPIALQTSEEALQYVHHGMEFDICIIDLSTGGITLASELRLVRDTLPLIGVSDVNLFEERALFDDTLLKPINVTLLLLSVVELLRTVKTPSYQQPIDNEDKPTIRELEIVVAEDDDHNIYTIKELLRTIGVRSNNVRYAKTGEECCKLCTERSPHIVLMDIRMPVMNGIEATRIVKRVNNPPVVIALSASIQSKDIIKCELAGFDSYLSKPITKEQLIDAIAPLVNSDGGKKNVSIGALRERRDRNKTKRRSGRKSNNRSKH